MFFSNVTQLCEIFFLQIMKQMCQKIMGSVFLALGHLLSTGKGQKSSGENVLSPQIFEKKHLQKNLGWNFL